MHIDDLMRPAAFPHPVVSVRLVETHISWVLLTGEFAYKIKKPVDFGFLDFSTWRCARPSATRRSCSIVASHPPSTSTSCR